MQLIPINLLKRCFRSGWDLTFKKWQIMKIKLPSWLRLYSQVIVATEHVLYLHTYISQVSSIIEPIRERHYVEGYFSTGKSVVLPTLYLWRPIPGLAFNMLWNGTIINDCRPTLTKCLTGGVWEKNNMIYTDSLCT